MSNSGSFQTRRLGNFDRSYKAVVKDHYRKNAKTRADFEERLARYLSALRIDPRPPPPFGHREPFPKGSHREGWELWKLDFDMPGLGGLAGHGRLIYMIDCRSSTVYLLWVYTHAKFPTRPPDRPLRQLIREAQEEVEGGA